MLQLGDRVIYLRVCDTIFSTFVYDRTFPNGTVFRSLSNLKSKINISWTQGGEKREDVNV